MGNIRLLVGIGIAVAWAWFSMLFSGAFFWFFLAAPPLASSFIWRAAHGKRADLGFFRRLDKAFGWKPWDVEKTAQDAFSIFVVAALIVMVASLGTAAHLEIGKQMDVLNNPTFGR